MARIPLLLALLCSLAAELPDGEALPTSRGELYDRVLRWFLTRTHRADERLGQPELLAEPIDMLLDILAPVAFHFAALPSGWTDLMSPGQLRDAVRIAGPAFTELDQSASDIVRHLSIGTGILVPAGNPSAGRHPSYLFLHRTVAEYLAARHLATLPATSWLEVVDQHLWFNPDWAEVIPLLGGQLGKSAARQLVDHLLDQVNDPFCHALLTAVRVIAERPDCDRVMLAERLKLLADGVLDLIDQPVVWHTTASVLAAMPQLPQLIVDGLLDRLDNPNPEVRQAAVKALTRCYAPAVTEKLLPLLDDPAAWVRGRAVKALAARDFSAVTEKLLACLGDPDWSVRRAAAEALARRDAPEVIDGLLPRLEAPDSNTRYAAVEALAGRDAPGVTKKLLALLDDPVPLVRGSAVEALAGRDAPEVIDGLLDRLDNPNPEVRRTAVEALAKCYAPAVTEKLLGRLGDPDTGVQSEAGRALAGRNVPAAARKLMAELKSRGPQPVPPSRKASSDRELWARIQMDITLEHVQQEIEEHPSFPDPELLRHAVNQLENSDYPTANEWLLFFLKHPAVSVRGPAVEVLARRNGAAVTAGLLECLDDPEVQHQAAEALAGRDAPGDLLALASRVRSLNPGTLRIAYSVAEIMAGRLYSRLSEESQASVRADLSWLTTVVLQSR